MSEVVLTERSFAEQIAEQGGRLFRVGGCVRDACMGVVPHDIDYCLTGMVRKQFKSAFPQAIECGKSFPVFRLAIDKRICEVAFARTERKEGSGYHGFKIQSNPKITILEDLRRRDTTINSMAVDCLSGELLDPFGGQQDIAARVLRATSEHFRDDPIRSLRLAGQAARLGFTVEASTLALAAQTRGELASEPAERMLRELTKVLSGAADPARFFEVLAAADLLTVTFPEIAALPENEFATLRQYVQAMARLSSEPKLGFAVLGLLLPEETRLAWNQRMTLPGEWLASANIVQRLVPQLWGGCAAEQLVEAASSLRRGALNASEFDLIAQAIRLPIPPLVLVTDLLEAHKAALAIPANLVGRQRGEWLRQQQVAVLLKNFAEIENLVTVR